MINTKVTIGTTIVVVSANLISTNGGPIDIRTYLMNGQKAIEDDGSS